MERNSFSGRCLCGRVKSKTIKELKSPTDLTTLVLVPKKSCNETTLFKIEVCCCTACAWIQTKNGEWNRFIDEVENFVRIKGDYNLETARDVTKNGIKILEEIYYQL